MKLYDKHGILLDKGEWKKVDRNNDIVEIGDICHNLLKDEIENVINWTGLEYKQAKYRSEKRDGPINWDNFIYYKPC